MSGVEIHFVSVCVYDTCRILYVTATLVRSVFVVWTTRFRAAEIRVIIHVKSPRCPFARTVCYKNYMAFSLVRFAVKMVMLYGFERQIIHLLGTQYSSLLVFDAIHATSVMRRI